VPAFPIANRVDFRRQSEPTPKSSATTKAVPVEYAGRSLWLRAESLAVLLCAVWLYAQSGQGWLLFALAFAVPDLSLVVHAVSRRAGAVVYNLAHSYVLGVGLGALGFTSSGSYLLPLALTWIAHISFDRLIGLPYPMDVRAEEHAVRRRSVKADDGGLL
jgi:hypothetical protein